MRSLRNFQSQRCKIASEGLLYPDNQDSRISVCCCFCLSERYSHSRTEVRRIHVIDGHRSSKRALCGAGGTEVGTGLFNVIVSRHGIQSRVGCDKGPMVGAVADFLSQSSTWSVEARQKWRASGGRARFALMSHSISYNNVNHTRICVMTLTSPPPLPLSRHWTGWSMRWLTQSHPLM